MKVPGGKALWVTTGAAGKGKDRILRIDLG